MRGRFIVLEGADGVGTTTQRGRLAAALALRGRRVHETAEPSTGAVGRLIRDVLRTRAHDEATRRELALLFAADRLEHVHTEIEPRLAAGTDVISDRYLLSSYVYQSLDLPLAWVKELNQHAPPADLTFLVTLPLDDALDRLGKRGGAADLFETRSLQERVHRLYAELAPLVNARIVDGRGSVDDVARRIAEATEPVARPAP